MAFNLVLAEIVKWIHNAILIFAVSGWLLNGEHLKAYLIANTIIVIQWYFNKNRCILTQWETVLRGGSKELDKKSEATFMGQVYHKILGYYPSYDFINYISYALMFFFTGIGFIKFFYFQ